MTQPMTKKCGISGGQERRKRQRRKYGFDMSSTDEAGPNRRKSTRRTNGERRQE